MKACAVWAGIVLATLAASEVGRAEDDSFGAWSGVFVQGKFAERWGWYFESQARVHDGYDQGGSPRSNVQRANRLLLRPAVRYLPLGDDSVQFHFGYGWTPNLSPSRDESRIYGQVTLQREIAGVRAVFRGRAEHRWIENAGGVSWRARALLRAAVPVDDQKKILAVVWDEWFYNLNEVDRGPVGGFDQNRFFVGPGFVVAAGARLEVGYMNLRQAAGRERQDLEGHVYVLNAFFDL